ncbi:hypothetical protein SUGI_0885230 [Cryptomeria japonica]|nr:hypothetical protein SUGI_0885230 [Cryptomeria japonica]
MAHLGDVSCVNCSNALGAQPRNLFVTEDFVYDAIQGLIGISLNFEWHWCDAIFLEAVLMPLIDVIESGERVVEDYLSSEPEDAPEEFDEDSGGLVDSDTRREMARREVWLEERKRLKVFGENAWEVFRCVVFNGNMAPFRNLTEAMEWWLPERSTNNVISIGEYVAVIYQALSGNMSYDIKWTAPKAEGSFTDAHGEIIISDEAITISSSSSTFDLLTKIEIAYSNLLYSENNSSDFNLAFTPDIRSVDADLRLRGFDILGLFPFAPIGSSKPMHMKLTGRTKFEGHVVKSLERSVNEKVAWQDDCVGMKASGLVGELVSLQTQRKEPSNAPSEMKIRA